LETRILNRVPSRLSALATRYLKPRASTRLSPAVLIVTAVTGLALIIRLYLLSRTRYLAGITEYDDGVYLGGAIDLLSGVLPYRDYAFVQPPGILLLMTPVALVAKVATASSAMAVARLATVAASAACVALTGSLVRHRGPLATLVACGILAAYPDDIMAAHTLLLEPWMNLLVLAGACLAFQRGRLAPPRRLLWAGVLLGLAAAVKYWALIPAVALLATCLAAGRREPDGDVAWPSARWWHPGGRAARFTIGAVAGFAVPVLPFAAPGLAAFSRSTLLDQVSRAGSAVTEPLRLAHLSGLAAALDNDGRLTLTAGSSSLFARGDVTATATWATTWLPVLAALTIAALLGLGYAAASRSAGARGRATAPADLTLADRAPESAAPAEGGGPGPLGWYALGTLAATLTAVLGYSAFFYHYADFPAPWLAIAAGYAAAGLAAWGTARQAAAPRRRLAPRLLAAVATVLFIVMAAQAWQLSGLYATEVTADAALIPKGACVVSDEISLTIAADRFPAAAAGCPVVLDALAQTLVTSNGVSIQGGATALPQVTARWEAILSRAQYVWLSPTSDRRIPWSGPLKRWFTRAFRPVPLPPGQAGEGQLYRRS
jgi:alpha-1,2-mannosyltransferase